MTSREIEILKALKVLGFRFLARDTNAHLFAYYDKPYKLPHYWVLDNSENIMVNSDLFDFIKWTDEEPIKIDDLLKENNKWTT